MKLDRTKDFGTVHGGAGIAFEQNGRYFNHGGNEVDDNGKPVKEVERAAPAAAPAAAAPAAAGAALGAMDADESDPAPVAATKSAAKAKTTAKTKRK